jgi:hypothetical protein
MRGNVPKISLDVTEKPRRIGVTEFYLLSHSVNPILQRSNAASVVNNGILQ